MFSDKLSKRMRMIADIVPPGEVIADIGTDHAYIPIELVGCGKYKRAIASDINKGPLDRARTNISLAGLPDNILLRRSDGLLGYLPGDADTVLIAGMGGRLTIHILDEGAEVLKKAGYLVLQPQSEIPSVRRWLRENGWIISDEDMVCEDGKYYVVMAAKKAGDVTGGERSQGGEIPSGAPDALRIPEVEDILGPVLIKKKHPVLRDWILWRTGVIDGVLKKLEDGTGDTLTRKEELLEEKRILSYGLEIY